MIEDKGASYNNIDLEEKQKTIIKANLIEKIKKWILLDTNIKLANDKIKKLRTMKQEITTEICEMMRHQTNTTELKQQKIKFSDGELRFYEKKDYSPLSFSYIEECLENILEDDTQIDYIIEYLRENREVNTSIDIKRIITKDDM